MVTEWTFTNRLHKFRLNSNVLHRRYTRLNKLIDVKTRANTRVCRLHLFVLNFPQNRGSRVIQYLARIVEKSKTDSIPQDPN